MDGREPEDANAEENIIEYAGIVPSRRIILSPGRCNGEAIYLSDG